MKRTFIPGRPPSELLTKQVLETSNGKVLLAFSAGKDAIAAWIALKEAGATVYPYYYYIHPDLGFINRALAYYEDYFGTRIARYPCPGLYQWWSHGVHQTPERCAVIPQMRIVTYDNETVVIAACQDFKIHRNTPLALGVKCADSVMRRTMFVRFGPHNAKSNKFYPIWDWTKAEVYARLYAAKVKLPIDYWMFGRSFDGLDYRFIAPVKKHYPEDYEKLLDYFPMLDAELKRGEFAGSTSHL